MQNSAYRQLPKALMGTMVYLIVAVSMLTITATFVEVPLENGDISNDALSSFVDWFHPNREQAIPTWISVLLLAACGMLLYVIGTVARLGKITYWPYWYLFALLFLLLSMDEALEFHEQLGWEILAEANAEHSSANHFISWVGVYAIIGLIVAVPTLRLFFYLPLQTRRGSLIAAAIFLTGAVGLDYLESLWEDYQGHDSGYVMNTLIWVEETMEMAGSAFFLYVLLAYLINHLLVSDPLSDTFTTENLSATEKGA